MAELRETKRGRQAQMVETLRVMGDMRREMGDMQAELLALREQPRRIRSLGPDAYSMTWEVLKKKITDKYCPQERQTNNKRKADNSSRNNHGHQQQPAKRQNIAKVYNMGSGEKKPYGGNLPKFTKCHFHRNGPCTQKFHKCNKVGHFAHDCSSSGNTNVINALRDNRANPKGNEKKGNASRDPDSNVITGTFLLNIRYASILFDIYADRSFISIAFSSLINIVLTPLGNSYDVKLADEKIVRAQQYMAKGCQMFLAQIFTKKEEDKSKGKQLKDVPIV
nr:hypothetical protein [Tanacetum cinerariifolium]